MKTRPRIEQSERDTILAQLRKRRKWTTSRAGARIRFWTEPTMDGPLFRYQIHLNRWHQANGKCSTLTAAIAAVNEELQASLTPRSQSTPNPMPIVVPAPPVQEYRLPYADN